MSFLRALLPHMRQERLAGGAIVLALTQFGASLAGFVRDQAFSVMFPLERDPLGVASIYIASFRLSDLLFQVFVMSSLSVVLVPFLAHHLAQERRNEMNRLTSSILLITTLLFGAVALVTAIFFPLIAPALTSYKGEALQLYITFGRYALLTNALFAVGNTLGQYLIAVQRYWIYGLTPIIWALGTIIGVYALTPILGPLGPMLGTVLGTIIYVVLRVIGVRRAGYQWSLPPQIIHPELASMGWLMMPRMAALGALQLQLLAFDKIASGLGPEAVAVNAFARNFQSVIIGVTGIALAQSAFSLLSQAAALKDMQRLTSYLKKGILFTLALTIPAALALATLAIVPAWLLRLASPVRELFMTALMIYCISIPFESLNHLVLRTFYALKNTTIPAITSALSVAAAIVTAVMVGENVGLYALPIAFTVGQVLQLFLLSCLLPGAMHAQERKGLLAYFRR